ncbi:MAG: alpha/beta fold hydrolase [Gemmatimonadaceae bacterium]|nr:alpha/beta fold hydrolase [Gemmatimonadaceae bacterium]
MKKLLVLALLTLACQSPSATATNTPSEASLSFSNGSVQLRGTLWTPSGGGLHPAVVLMGGNGPWRPARGFFDQIRDALLAQGIAVAYYDRRGEGLSTGDFDRSSFEELAGDAVSAVNAIRASAGIAPGKVGLWGHSMGGWIAPLAASQSSSVAFVITAAGPGVGPLDQTLYARENEDRAAGVPEQDVKDLAALRRAIVEYYTYRTAECQQLAQQLYTSARSRPWIKRAMTWRELQGVGATLPSPQTLAAIDAQDPDVLRWFRRDGLYEPAIALQKCQAPTLAIFGEADQTVPLAPSVSALQASFEAAGKKSLLQVATFASADHMIMVPSGSLAPGFLATMTTFVGLITK